jgi:hypothetical protein
MGNLECFDLGGLIFCFIMFTNEEKIFSSILQYFRFFGYFFNFFWRKENFHWTGLRPLSRVATRAGDNAIAN